MADQVLRTVHESFATSMGILAASCGGTVSDDDGLFLYATPAPSTYPWNGALRTAPGLSPELVVERAQSFFEGLGQSYSLLALEGLDDDMITHLGESDTTSPEMVMTHPPHPVELPDGVGVEVVETPRSREQFIETAAEAFETLGESPDTWTLCYPTLDSLANPVSVAMVLYERGRPAATGMYYRSESVIEILHIGTRPSFRRRGYGRMVTTALTIHGFEHGAAMASLQAEPMGYSTYERIGYQTVSTYHAYVNPSPRPTA